MHTNTKQTIVLRTEKVELKKKTCELNQRVLWWEIMPKRNHITVINVP